MRRRCDAVHEFGYVGLADARPRAGLELGKSKFSYTLCDPAGKCGFQLKLFRVRKAKIGKDIPATSGYRNGAGGRAGQFSFRLAILGSAALVQPPISPGRHCLDP